MIPSPALDEIAFCVDELLRRPGCLATTREMVDDYLAAVSDGKLEPIVVRLPTNPANPYDWSTESLSEAEGTASPLDQLQTVAALAALHDVRCPGVEKVVPIHDTPQYGGADDEQVPVELIRAVRWLATMRGVRRLGDYAAHWFRLQQPRFEEVVTLGAGPGSVGRTAPERGLTEKKPTAAPSPRTGKEAKRSTVKGEGRDKLIAALTLHHEYEDESVLNPAPIGNNALARLAEVSPSTASDFFEKEFEGYDRYKSLCHTDRVRPVLKALNDGYSPHELFGGRPPNEDDRDRADRLSNVE